jgi:hypothetical protein
MVLQWSPRHYGIALIAQLKRLHSPDIQDLRNWIPESKEFAILLQIMAGPEGSPGEESFDVTLCTPAWIKNQVEREGVITGRHLLIIADYDYGQVNGYISRYLTTCTGNTWQEVAAKIARLGHWEFEDYRS